VQSLSNKGIGWVTRRTGEAETSILHRDQGGRAHK